MTSRDCPGCHRSPCVARSQKHCKSSTIFSLKGLTGRCPCVATGRNASSCRASCRFTTPPESPATLLHAAAESIRPRAEDKQLEVRVEAPADLALVAVDAERFGHALNNLLDNAVAYTNRGGRITLSAARLGDIIELKV